MINVFMVDSNISTIKEVKQYFEGSEIAVTNYKVDGKEALDELLNHNNYDVILMDPVLPTLDGIDILRRLEEHNIKNNIIIYSNFNNENLVKMLSKYNISFFLFKSISLDVLKERIIDSTKLVYQEFDIVPNYLEEKVSKLLHDLGMPSHIKGYQYIRDAIKLMHSNPKVIGGITKVVYPYIANKYQTTSSRVERAMRHAIEVSWSRGDYDLMDEIFGHSVDFDKAKPTNSEFLATIADKISIEEKQKIFKGNHI